MKLRRFTALTTQKALKTVNEALGPDALIYSTRRIPNGIEVIAGDPVLDNTVSEAGDVISIQANPSVDEHVIDKLNLQLQMMEESVKGLTDQITYLHITLKENATNQNSKWWKLIKNKFHFKKYINKYEQSLIGIQKG